MRNLIALALVIGLASTVMAQPIQPNNAAPPGTKPFSYKFEDKCPVQYQALGDANTKLNQARQVIRGLPRMVPGQAPMDEPKELTDLRRGAMLQEAQAGMAYEDARAKYMQCEQGVVK